MKQYETIWTIWNDTGLHCEYIQSSNFELCCTVQPAPDGKRADQHVHDRTKTTGKTSGEELHRSESLSNGKRHSVRLSYTSQSKPSAYPHRAHRHNIYRCIFVASIYRYSRCVPPSHAGECSGLHMRTILRQTTSERHSLPYRTPALSKLK